MEQTINFKIPILILLPLIFCQVVTADDLSKEEVSQEVLASSLVLEILDVDISEFRAAAIEQRKKITRQGYKRRMRAIDAGGFFSSDRVKDLAEKAAKRVSQAWDMASLRNGSDDQLAEMVMTDNYSAADPTSPRNQSSYGAETEFGHSSYKDRGFRSSAQSQSQSGTFDGDYFSEVAEYLNAIRTEVFVLLIQDRLDVHTASFYMNVHTLDLKEQVPPEQFNKVVKGAWVELFGHLHSISFSPASASKIYLAVAMFIGESGDSLTEEIRASLGSIVYGIARDFLPWSYMRTLRNIEKHLGPTMESAYGPGWRNSQNIYQAEATSKNSISKMAKDWAASVRGKNVSACVDQLLFSRAGQWILKQGVPGAFITFAIYQYLVNF